MRLVLTTDKSGEIISLVAALYRQFPSIEQELRDTIAKCKKGITLEIKPYASSRTRQQEKYYWKWLREFADHTGNTPDEMHDHILREAYGSEYVETALGIKIRPMQRSSTATLEEYSKLIDTLIRTAANFCFIIPPPLTVVDLPEENGNGSSENKQA